MPICQERLAHLLEVYSSRKATDAEMQELFQYLRDSDNQEPVNEHIRQLVEEFDPNEPIPSVNWDSLYQQILEQNSAVSGDNDFPAGAIGGYRTERPVLSRRFSRGRFMAAASLIILVSAGAFYFLSLPSKHPIVLNHPPQALKATADVQPGADGAILTLANGQQIVLDSAGNGALGVQGNTKLLNQHGQLSYRHIPGNGEEEVLYNTITTARGKQYQLVLADGSRVWLNAASSIKFPTTFTGNTRSVEMMGEAYFEIAPNASKPFKVHIITPPSGNFPFRGQGAGAGDQGEVQVLGTHFNVNAYDDETLTRTTLLEGSIKVLPPAASGKESGQVAAGGGGRILRPGEQAQYPNSSHIGAGAGSLKVINDPDIEEVLAWKEGLFVMKKAGISSIMRQIARWYDVEIVYKNGIPTGRISGDIPRNMNLSKVLQVMELSGVHFTIDGKKVVVAP